MIQTLNVIYKNDFDCFEPAVGDKFFYGENGLHVLETQVDTSGTACSKTSNCYFRDKRNECPCFSCSKRERDDGYDVKFVDITTSYSQRELEEIIRNM